MQQARDDRQQRIVQAIAKGEGPKQRDIRPHHRTLAHRARKKGPLSLTITDRRLFQVSNEGQTLSSRQCSFTVTLRAHQDLKFLDIRSIRLVPVQNYGTRTPLGRRHYCLHVQVAVPEPVPIENIDIENPADILGTDRGTKNHLAVSSGHRAHNSRSGKQRTRRRKHQHDIAGKPRGSKRRRHAVAKAREQSGRYTQRRDQDLRRQIRDILLEAKPKMVAVESLHPISMMASARGTSAAPGKNVAAKRKLNASLAESAIATWESSYEKKPPNSGYPPSPSHRRARPRPARTAETGTVTTARAKRCSGAGNAVSKPTPTGLLPSLFATGLTPGTANGGLDISQTY